MENPMGFAHFLTNTDAIARAVLALMLLASVGTWYLIIVKGGRIIRMRQRSEAFLDAFWAAPNLEATIIQATHTEGMVRLFGRQYLRAENYQPAMAKARRAREAARVIAPR